MREILFRGKNSTGNWIYGNLNFYPDINRTFIRKNNKELLPSFQTSLEEEVNKNTVGQFTGLTDKNGTKIFEGDIVERAWNNEDSFVYSVIFDPNLCSFIAKRDFGFSTLDSDFKVIGNIHDNPELLENEAEGE